MLNCSKFSNRAIGYTTSRDSGNQWRHEIVPSTVRYSVAPSSLVFGKGMNNTYRYYAMHRTRIGWWQTTIMRMTFKMKIKQEKAITLYLTFGNFHTHEKIECNWRIIRKNYQDFGYDILTNETINMIQIE